MVLACSYKAEWMDENEVTKFTCICRTNGIYFALRENAGYSFVFRYNDKNHNWGSTGVNISKECIYNSGAGRCNKGFNIADLQAEMLEGC